MDFFSFFKGKQSSSKEAKDRLQVVIIHDRIGVSPELLERIKDEILQVLLKYVEIDKNEFAMSVTQTKSEDGGREVPALIANIPITKMKPKEDFR